MNCSSSSISGSGSGFVFPGSMKMAHVVGLTLRAVARHELKLYRNLRLGLVVRTALMLQQPGVLPRAAKGVDPRLRHTLDLLANYFLSHRMALLFERMSATRKCRMRDSRRRLITP
jgi:hypothetical protein